MTGIADGRREHELNLELVEGLHCAACVSRAEHLLNAIPGVTRASVNLATRSAHMHFAPESTTIAAIKTRLADAGFVPQEAAEGAILARDSHQAAAALAKARAFQALALVAPLMVLSMAQLALPGSGWVEFALSSTILLGPGRSILSAGARSLWRLRPDMDALIAIGSSAGWLFSSLVLLEPSFWNGTAPLSFEASGSIIAVVLVGRWFEVRARASTGAALTRLLARQGTQAHVIIDGSEQEVPLSVIEVGDLVRVRPGEQIPVDGELTDGASSVDEAIITGETRMIPKAAGAAVIGGSTNGHGTFVMRTTAIGADTAIGRMAALVRRAQGAKPPIARLADRVSGWFVPIVCGLAAVTAALWLLLAHDPARAIQAAAGVLVIACPCALGLATPTAVLVAVGRAAELGLLIRNGVVIESASTVDTVLFDKTGTLTVARPVVVDLIAEPSIVADELLRLAAAAEQGSEHILASAVRNAVPAIHRPAQVTDFTALPGQGVSAVVDGTLVLVGSEALMRAHRIDGDFLARMLARLDPNVTPVFVAIDGRPGGVIALADQARSDAAEAVAAVRALGADVMMLTGDRVTVAGQVAKAVGIDRIHAQALPDDKLARIHALQASGHRVAMVGDGLNDGPSLAGADVGMTMGTGSDVAAEAGDVILLGNRLAGVATTIALSRATMRTIRQNLIGATCYNLLALPLAAGAFYPWTGRLIDPMMAASLMALSSLTVVGNSLRLRRFHG